MLTRQGMQLKAFEEETYLYRKTMKELEHEQQKSKNRKRRIYI